MGWPALPLLMAVWVLTSLPAARDAWASRNHARLKSIPASIKAPSKGSAKEKTAPSRTKPATASKKAKDHVKAKQGTKGHRPKKGRATPPAHADRVIPKQAPKPKGALRNGREHHATWAQLHNLVQQFRVGALAGLEPKLVDLVGSADGDVERAAALVLARTQASLQAGDFGAKALELAKPVRQWLPASWDWAQIEVERAANRQPQALEHMRDFRKQYGEFRWAAADLLYSRLAEQAAPPQEVAEIALSLYEKSALHLPRDELLARAARASEQIAGPKAMGLWRKLLLQHPESEYVAEAASHVDLASLSDAENYDRVALLFARRAYERCREAGKPLWFKGYRASEVGYFLGKIGSERLRDDYTGASDFFEAAIVPDAPHAAAALSSYALVLGKLGRFDESIAKYDEWLRRYPNVGNERRVELHYDRARMLHVSGKSIQAAQDMAKALAEDERGIDALKYQWFVGFWFYLGKDYTRALEAMKPLLANPNPLVGGKANYWTAKALDRLERRDEAVAVLDTLLKRYPLTYYSALGERLLTDWDKSDHLPKVTDFSKIVDTTADPFAHLPSDPQLDQLRLACSVGEPDSCQVAWDTAEKPLRKLLGDEELQRLQQALADPLERYADARDEALRQNGHVLSKLPTMQTLADWRAIYPRAFATHTVAASKRSGAPEWMIYAHMLQESRYKPWLISGAPAYGLLELLDRTAARLAKDAGDDYQLWMLMQPRYNIAWGGRYLGALYHKFHKQLPFAIASYNGGPMLMEYHLRVQKKLGRDFDELIDDLGPHESRNYVRMVIGWLVRYVAIYETPKRAAELRDQLLPRQWSAEFEKDPNF